MTAEALNQMVEELIERCDGLESSGLVDYQMGVAEEEIISCKLVSRMAENQAVLLSLTLSQWFISAVISSALARAATLDKKSQRIRVQLRASRHQCLAHDEPVHCLCANTFGVLLPSRQNRSI